MQIRQAKKEDAPFLARVVMEAIGPELCLGLAESADRLPLVEELFTILASEVATQYSFHNAYVAESDSGKLLGGIIAYDGFWLRRFRPAFVREANRILGWNVTPEEAESWGDEADFNEIYIDSLYVVPEARKQGVSTALLKAIERKYERSDKPLGLLVEPENKQARQIYEHWGFREVGVNNFFRTPMTHMQQL